MRMQKVVAFGTSSYPYLMEVAGGYNSRGLYRGRGPEKAVLVVELSGDAVLGVL